jgi:hypothetical protein
MSLGGALVVALLSVVLYWFTDRWRPLLLCSALGFTLALFYYLIARRWLHNDPYDWFAPRLVAITASMTLIAGLFVWLLLVQFKVPRRAWWLGALLPMVVGAWTAVPLFEMKTLWLCRAMLAVALPIAAWALWRRRPGATLVLVAVLAGLVFIRANRQEFLDQSFFLTVGGLMITVFVTLGLQVRAQRQQAHEALLTAVRLETELLKKNIQPHFLLNTLATIIEVIEQDPKIAVSLIEALAGEFRILARVAGEKLIPLAHELELCRAHLRIMSLRKCARCSLEVAPGVDEHELVPPALFHTLIENGLTHLLPRDAMQRFELDAVREAGRVRYTLVADGEPTDRVRAPAGAVSGAPTPARPEGTGLRYVKARLEESFPGRWTLRGEAVPEGWRTVITIDRVMPPAGGKAGWAR